MNNVIAAIPIILFLCFAGLLIHGWIKKLPLVSAEKKRGREDYFDKVSEDEIKAMPADECKQYMQYKLRRYSRMGPDNCCSICGGGYGSHSGQCPNYK